MEYRFKLERYRAGGATKHTCPNCGRRKCFTRYIDTDTGEYVDDICGKCDHECSCGYHYPPKDYYRDHPTHNSWEPPTISRKPPVIKVEKPKPKCFIPKEYVDNSRSPDSVFWTWMQKLAPDADALQKVFDDYHIGATRDGAVIFWQIDIHGRIRTGKIMHYTTDGHRTGYPNWVHSKLKDSGAIAKSWELSQCFFGEHLLAKDNSKVCLVESEKTALICALFYPQFTWLATGGCKQLTADKCRVLKGRRVIVYPDSGCLEEWSGIMASTSGIAYSMVHDLESEPPNTDIADVLLREVLQP